MLRIIINILILVLIMRVIGSLTKRVRRRFGHNAASRRGDGEDSDPKGESTKGESNEGLSPYEIEDADYEEIKPDRD